MIDGFHRRLSERLADVIADRQAALLQGVSSNSVDEVALRYARDASYLLALHDVLNLAQEVEGDMYGEQAKKVLNG
jgi:hypothetical protein